MQAPLTMVDEFAVLEKRITDLSKVIQNMRLEKATLKTVKGGTEFEPGGDADNMVARLVG